MASLHRQQVDRSFSCFVAHLESGSLEPVWQENYSWLNANSRSYFQCQRRKCLGSSKSLLPLNFGKLDFLKCRFLHFAIISELFYETLYVRKVLCNVLPSDRTKKKKTCSEFHDKSGELNKNQKNGRQHNKLGDSQSNREGWNSLNVRIAGHLIQVPSAVLQSSKFTYHIILRSLSLQIWSFPALLVSFFILLNCYMK